MVILGKRISRKVTFRFSKSKHNSGITLKMHNFQQLQLSDVSILILDKIRKSKSFLLNLVLVECSLRFFNHA